jgi:hypothetical protein
VSNLREPLARPCSRFCRFGFTIFWRTRRFESVQEAVRRCRDLIDRSIECCLIGLRWMREREWGGLWQDASVHQINDPDKSDGCCYCSSSSPDAASRERRTD